MSECPPIARFFLEKGPIHTPRWVAFFVRGSGVLPLYFLGDSDDEVTEKARAFWAANSRKYAPDDEPKPVNDARLAALAKARATRAAKAKPQTAEIVD